MDNVYVTAVVSAVVAAILYVAFNRMFGSKIPQGVDDGRYRQLENEVASLRSEKSEAERRLAAEEQKAARVQALEMTIAEKTSAIDELRMAKGAVDQDLAAARETIRQNEETTRGLQSRLDEAEKARLEVQSRYEALKDEKAELDKSQREKISRLEETLGQERKQSEEKLGLLREAREQMSNEFRVLAEDIMKNHGESFSKQNKDQMDGILAPLKENILKFETSLQSALNESSKERVRLDEQIRQLTETSTKMSTETHNLTQALKGKSQTQGAWGEMILSTILERSGLRKGEEYLSQESFSTVEGGQLRPDVIVNLPNTGKIIIDAKVSLTAYENHIKAENDAERATSLKGHVQSLKGHIKALSAKEYQNAAGGGLNFVIMFVPIEGALALAMQAEPSLSVDAVGAHVAIATPTTLMVALRTVSSLWQVERRNQNAEAIAERAGKLYDKFVGFVEDMQGLGKRLEQAQTTYGEAMGKLTSGRGNLINQIDQLKSMGAKTAKALPMAEQFEDEVVSLPPPDEGSVATSPAL